MHDHWPPGGPVNDELIGELRALLSCLGDGGGRMSASVYDPAQALRLAPSPEVRPVLGWLLRNQEPDGGWGDSVEPLTHDSSTLAAVLALQPYQRDAQVRAAMDRALAFLGGAAERWSDPLSEGLPVGV